MSGILFDVDGPRAQWHEFCASGYERPVCGVVFRKGDCSRGMPLGGIGTGCVDLNSDGTLGLCSIFHSFAPPRDLNSPLFDLAISGTRGILVSSHDSTSLCSDILYWGHYPIADLQFCLRGPLRMALRAWSPFLPGDAQASNTPVIFFDVTLQNQSGHSCSGALTCHFPRPSIEEATSCTASRLSAGGLTGARIDWKGGSYALMALDGRVNSATDEAVFAGEAQVSVDFELAARDSKELSFCLAWYVPRWAGSDAHHFRQAYAMRFAKIEEVLDFAIEQRASWLQRIVRWQSEIYRTAEFPFWLRDQLINVLHTITEDSFWAGESIPGDRWYAPLGIFALTESPRTTPHICNPSDWYGTLPIVFFFPELMHSLLRLYVHFQLRTGEVPLGVGHGADLFHPSYHMFQVMNSCVHIHLIDRLWQRDRNQAVLEEFYPSAVQALEFLRSCDRDGDGLPELDADPVPNQFYGAWPWYGVAVHVSGFWLSALRMMERMAEAAHDTTTLERCRTWRSKAQASLEEKLWSDTHYLVFHDPMTGSKSRTVLANQLAGQWCSRLHGLGGTFPDTQVRQTLGTVKATCVSATAHGALNSLRPDGSVDDSAPTHSNGIFTGECLCLAATLIYEGDREAGEEVSRRMMSAIVLQDGAGWELPNILDREGRVIHGNDFYQMMILWALPLAIEGQDIAAACAPQNLVGRIRRAAAAT